MAIVLSACGGGAAPTGAATTAPAAGAAATTNAVTIQGFAFSPASIQVGLGTTVIWTNTDGTTHTVSSGKPGTKDGKFDQLVNDKATFTFTFSQAGVYEYFCSIHTSMTGRVEAK